MAKTKELKRKYRVTLAAKNGAPRTDQQVNGNSMQVNHRGDLLIVERQSYGENNLIAVFRSGSWQSAELVTEGTSDVT